MQCGGNREMAALAPAILALRALSDRMLTAFCEMAPRSAERCSRRSNIALNQPRVHLLLERCSEPEKAPHLARLGKMTLKVLKSREPMHLIGGFVYSKQYLTLAFTISNLQSCGAGSRGGRASAGMSDSPFAGGFQSYGN
jgi:hypothetical protein